MYNISNLNFIYKFYYNSRFTQWIFRLNPLRLAGLKSPLWSKFRLLKKKESWKNSYELRVYELVDDCSLS